jgi:hypothetical protein
LDFRTAAGGERRACCFPGVPVCPFARSLQFRGGVYCFGARDVATNGDATVNRISSRHSSDPSCCHRTMLMRLVICCSCWNCSFWLVYSFICWQPAETLSHGGLDDTVGHQPPRPLARGWIVRHVPPSCSRNTVGAQSPSRSTAWSRTGSQS